MQDSILIVVTVVLVLIALIVTKTVFFYKAARKRKFSRWVFFSQYDIVNAASDRIRYLRKWQNALSILIIILLIVSGVLIFLVEKEML